MTAARARLELAPRGLNRLQAAARVGVSVTTFERMVAEGLMPPPRQIYSLRVWDIAELDLAFDDLPHAGGSPAPKSPANLPIDDFT